MSEATGSLETVGSFLSERIDELKRLGGAVTVGLLLFLPLMGLPEAMVALMTTMFIYGLFALGYDLVIGYTGMVSFGHAMFFGLGAYSFTLAAQFLQLNSVWLLLAVAVVVPTIVGLGVSVISIKSRGIYFAILTLAWYEITFTLIFNFTDITGGSNGVVVATPQLVVVPGVLEASPDDPAAMYYVSLVLLLATFYLLYRLVQSPMGAVLKGIRENPDRIQYLGYDERWYRIVAFTISCGVAGLSGALLAIHIGYISPSVMELLLNGEVIVWTLLGGKGTLIGPILGAAFVIYLEHTFSSIVSWWLVPVGIIFIAIVIFMPEGVYGKFREKARGFFNHYGE